MTFIIFCIVLFMFLLSVFFYYMLFCSFYTCWNTLNLQTFLKPVHSAFAALNLQIVPCRTFRNKHFTGYVQAFAKFLLRLFLFAFTPVSITENTVFAFALLYD